MNLEDLALFHCKANPMCVGEESSPGPDHLQVGLAGLSQGKTLQQQEGAEGALWESEEDMPGLFDLPFIPVSLEAIRVWGPGAQLWVHILTLPPPTLSYTTSLLHIPVSHPHEDEDNIAPIK